MDIVVNAEIAAMPENNTPIANQHHYYHNILTCLHYSEAYPPVASLLSRLHGLEGVWLIASPVHWQATHNDAMIVACGEGLNISLQESRLWFEALAELVALDNIKLHFHDAHTWLIQCDGKPPLTAKPVHRLLHQSLMPQLKSLDTTLYWQQWMTEIQMFFSTHLLNQSRTGLYPINGVWLWGSGELPVAGEIPIIAEEEEQWGLARILSKNVNSYHSTSVFINDNVLLFGDLSEQERTVLQARLQKSTVRWYWNNLAYVSKPQNWFSRMIGRMK